MATTEDLRFYDGTSWQSLTELTASKVEAKLPIESVDGTVVLSDSSGRFIVSTGGPSVTRFTVTDTVITSKVNIQSPSLSGLNSNDASVSLGATCNIDAASGLVVKTSGHSAARLYVQDKYTQCNGPLWISSGTAAAPGIRCSNENTGLCIGENSTNIISASLDGTIYMSLQPNENSFINVAKVTGSKDPDNDASVSLGGQATLTKGDGSEYVPSDAASIPTKKYCDDKVWVGTTAQYNAIATKNPTTLYCLTD